MRFKPGDKVWLHVIADWRMMPPEWKPSRLDIGRHPAVILGYLDSEIAELDVEGYTPPQGSDGTFAHESLLLPRDDPPPQQESKRDAVGSWDHCVWKPSVTA